MKSNSLILLLFVLFTSCVKERIEVREIDSSISPEFGIPLAKATIYAEDVIERYDDDGLVTTDDEGVLTLIYQDSLESISADRYLSLDDQQIDDTYELNASDFSDLVNFGSVSVEQDDIYNFQFGDDRLDSIRFASGVLAFTINSDGTLPLSGEISLLDPFNGENFMTLSFSDQTPPIFIDAEEDFTNLLLRLRSDDQYTNGIRVAVNFTLTDNGGTYPDEVSFDLSLEDFSIASAGGYIAPRTITLENQEANISIFDDDYQGDLRLEDPTLNLFFINGYGVGVRPVVNRIVGINNDGDSLVVPGSQIDQLPIVAQAPVPGQVGLSEIQIDNESMTPTVTDFMTFEPNKVRGELSLEINPENNQSNFISQGTSLDINFEVELPIYGSLANFGLTDTTEIDFGDVVESADDVQEIEQLDIRLFVKNALPVEAGIQMVFVDDQLNRIDSLFTEPTIVVPAAPVDLSAPVGTPNYGRVIGETEARIDISIPRERIDPLENVTQVIVEVFGNTTGNGGNPIRLYPENFIQVNLAAKAIFNLELE
jgi:hypothetical protein